MLNGRLLRLSVFLLLTLIASQAQTSGSANPKPDPSIARISELREQSKLATKNRDWQKLEQVSQELVTDFGGQFQDYQSLGDAQLNLGKYNESIRSYEKALEIAGMTTFAPPHLVKEEERRESVIARLLTSEGNAYLKLRKNEDAIRMFMRAAEISPNPGTAYFNICATAYNTANIDGAVSACRKAIQADPKRADAYFVLGSCLFSDSHMDKNNRLVAPPEALDALNKYLELAPDGPHAKDVKDMLEAAGQKK